MQPVPGSLWSFAYECAGAQATTRSQAPGTRGTPSARTRSQPPMLEAAGAARSAVRHHGCTPRPADVFRERLALARRAGMPGSRRSNRRAPWRSRSSPTSTSASNGSSHATPRSLPGVAPSADRQVMRFRSNVAFASSDNWPPGARRAPPLHPEISRQIAGEVASAPRDWQKPPS